MFANSSYNQKVTCHCGERKADQRILGRQDLVSWRSITTYKGCRGAWTNGLAFLKPTACVMYLKGSGR
jgi:hypothetical protein